MAKLNRQEIAFIRKIQQDPAWEVIEKLQKLRIQSLRAGVIGGQDAFQELRELHKAQGGAEALAKFFEDLERAAFDDDE